nr:DUF6056 family protein [Desulfovibrio sp.]
MLTPSAWRKTSTLLSVLFLWSVMFVLSLWSPPMTDNYLFSRNMIPGYAQFMAGAPIERLEPMTLKAAFDQAVTMYHTWCGRFMGNLLVYLAFMLPSVLLAAASSAGFVVLCVLMHACIYGRMWREKLGWRSLLGIAALLWAGIPSFGSAFFWVSVGGLVALIAQCVFLLPFRFAMEDGNAGITTESWAACVGYFALGTATASLDYATSAAMPVAAAVGTFWFFIRQKPPRLIPRLYLSAFLGVSLGAAATLLAPGNACRMAITTDAAVHEWFDLSWGERFIDYCLHVPQAFFLQAVPLILLIWACWALCRCHGREWIRRIPPSAFFFLVPFAATHGAYFFTPWPPSRAFATSAMQLIIASSILAIVARDSLSVREEEEKPRRVYLILQTILCLFCVLSLVDEFWKFHAVHLVTKERDAIYASQQGKDVIVPPMPVRGDRYMVLGTHLQDVFFSPKHWVNRAVAANRGVSSVALRELERRHFETRISDVNGLSCLIRGQQCSNTLEVDIDVCGDIPKYSKLFFYYYGVPGLLHFFPQFLADGIAMNLDESVSGAQTLLLPLFFARAEAKLTWRKLSEGHVRGTGS